MELLSDERLLARQKPELLDSFGTVLMAWKADAVPLLAAAQAHYPNDFWLNFDLGKALYIAKRLKEAAGFYRAAIAVRPSSVLVHSNLGIVLHDDGQLDQAIQEYRRAIESDPKFATAHNNLGVTLRDKGQLDEAIQEFRRAVEIISSSPRLT